MQWQTLLIMQEDLPAFIRGGGRGSADPPCIFELLSFFSRPVTELPWFAPTVESSYDDYRDSIQTHDPSLIYLNPCRVYCTFGPHQHRHIEKHQQICHASRGERDNNQRAPSTLHMTSSERWIQRHVRSSRCLSAKITAQYRISDAFVSCCIWKF